jgi:hypothetical protein
MVCYDRQLADIAEDKDMSASSCEMALDAWYLDNEPGKPHIRSHKVDGRGKMKIFDVFATSPVLSQLCPKRFENFTLSYLFTYSTAKNCKLDKILLIIYNPLHTSSMSKDDSTMLVVEILG